jgi:hypothetical protein
MLALDKIARSRASIEGGHFQNWSGTLVAIPAATKARVCHLMPSSSISLYIGITDAPVRWEGVMPKLIFARSPQGQEEEYRTHELVRSRHGPARLILHARIIVASWQGQRTTAIADALNCYPQTVRKHITRFNLQRLASLGDRPGVGRKTKRSPIPIDFTS